MKALTTKLGYAYASDSNPPPPPKSGLVNGYATL